MKSFPFTINFIPSSLSLPLPEKLEKKIRLKIRRR